MGPAGGGLASVARYPGDHGVAPPPSDRTSDGVSDTSHFTHITHIGVRHHTDILSDGGGCYCMSTRVPAGSGIGGIVILEVQHQGQPWCAWAKTDGVGEVVAAQKGGR
jgi:hypothetical protein